MKIHNIHSTELYHKNVIKTSLVSMPQHVCISQIEKNCSMENWFKILHLSLKISKQTSLKIRNNFYLFIDKRRCINVVNKTFI